MLKFLSQNIWICNYLIKLDDGYFVVHPDAASLRVVMTVCTLSHSQYCGGDCVASFCQTVRSPLVRYTCTRSHTDIIP